MNGIMYCGITTGGCDMVAMSRSIKSMWINVNTRNLVTTYFIQWSPPLEIKSRRVMLRCIVSFRSGRNFIAFVFIDAPALLQYN